MAVVVIDSKLCDRSLRVPQELPKETPGNKAEHSWISIFTGLLKRRRKLRIRKKQPSKFEQQEGRMKEFGLLI